VRAAVPTAVCAALLLTGCATDVRGELRKEVADITEAANDRDADGVRREVEDLDGALDDAVRSGELTSAEAAAIAALAASVRERAALLETPEPAPHETTEPTPSPAATPRSPSPSPPEQEPEDSEEPEEPDEPEEPEQDEPTTEQTEGDVVPTEVPLSPAAQQETAAGTPPAT
jgi:hypothetical protein